MAFSAMKALMGAGQNSLATGFWGGALAMNGLDFITESTFVAFEDLSAFSTNPFGVSAEFKAYFAGGFQDPIYLENIDIFQFLTQTISDLGSTLPEGDRGRGFSVYSDIKGYFMGGPDTIVRHDEIDGVLFSNDTTINPSAVLSDDRFDGAAVSSDIKGYASGGTKSVTGQNTTDGIIFSSDTAFDPSANLVNIRFNHMAFQDDVHGYWLGGRSSFVPTIVNYDDIEGHTFSNDAAYPVSNNLTVEREFGAGLSARLKGYTSGGIRLDTGFTDDIEGMDWATETCVVISATVAGGSGGVVGHIGVQSWTQI